MLSAFYENPDTAKESEHKEGDLYKIVTTFDKTFELRYGYYGEKGED